MKVAALVTGSTLLVMLLALAEFFHLVGTRLRHDECCDEKITAVPVDSLDSLQQNHCQRISHYHTNGKVVQPGHFHQF